jgi:Predicted transcriptional regulator
MNRLEISVVDPSAALDGFADAWHQAELGHPQPAKLAFGSLHALFDAITERRVLLMRAAAAQERATLQSLAEALGQDLTATQTDIDSLLSLGLLEQRGDGGLTAPFDEIVIHAGIRNAA